MSLFSLTPVSMRFAIVIALGIVFSGCGYEWQKYPSPVAVGKSIEYRYMTRSPEGGERKGSPTGVRIETSGVRVAVWSPRSTFHEHASAEAPDPICAVDKAIILIPPIPWIFSESKGTDRFEIEIAIAGAANALDFSQVTLTGDGGTALKPVRVRPVSADSHQVGTAWIIDFDTACDPYGVYDLALGSVAVGRDSIAIPSIHFVTGSQLAFSAP